MEVELLALALATGVLDATTFPDYHVFASNQTGNTALLAVGALGLETGLVDLENIGVSPGCFFCGGFIFGPRCRAWLLASTWVQTALMLVATSLRQFVTTSTTGSGALSIIALPSFSSGGQVACAGTINVPEITTAMVTSTYIDSVVDLQNRRMSFVLSLILGSFIGAALYRHTGASSAFLLAACIKFAVILN